MTRRLTPPQRVALAALVRDPLNFEAHAYRGYVVLDRYPYPRGFSRKTIKALEDMGLARRAGESAFATARGLAAFQKGQSQ